MFFRFEHVDDSLSHKRNAEKKWTSALEHAQTYVTRKLKRY